MPPFVYSSFFLFFSLFLVFVLFLFFFFLAIDLGGKHVQQHLPEYAPFLRRRDEAKGKLSDMLEIKNSADAQRCNAITRPAEPFSFLRVLSLIFLWGVTKQKRLFAYFNFNELTDSGETSDLAMKGSCLSLSPFLTVLHLLCFQLFSS